MLNRASGKRVSQGRSFAVHLEPAPGEESWDCYCCQTTRSTISTEVSPFRSQTETAGDTRACSSLSRSPFSHPLLHILLTGGLKTTACATEWSCLLCLWSLWWGQWEVGFSGLCFHHFTADALIWVSRVGVTSLSYPPALLTMKVLWRSSTRGTGPQNKPDGLH